MVLALDNLGRCLCVSLIPLPPRSVTYHRVEWPIVFLIRVKWLWHQLNKEIV